jgi:hypothetical protein
LCFRVLNYTKGYFFIIYRIIEDKIQKNSMNIKGKEMGSTRGKI